MASQAVYHALKAPSDPPRVGGPSKIQIAATAWDDKSLYMPNKGEVIAEWILTKLLKDKANLPALNPVLDPRFWTLLSEIVSDQTKGTKHWLLPVLNRVPLAPVLASFLENLGAVEPPVRLPLATAVSKSLRSIWPLAVHKISAETLLDSFGAFLRVFEQISEANNALEQIGESIISSLRVSVGNSSNKKKLSSLFIQNHLRAWIASTSNQQPSSLRENVYIVGTDILFNVDTLRQMHDEEHPFFLGLRDIPDELVHPGLPRLFASFVQCTRKHRSALFGQTSGHSSAAVTEQVRAASFSFFDSCHSLLNVAIPTAATWGARVGLLTVVGDENLFSTGQLGGQMSLQSTVPLVLSVLGSDCGYNAETASLATTCLSKLMQIDHDLILKDVPRILSRLLHIPDVLPSIFDFLELLLEYHVKTRTMHTHVETLFAAMVAPQTLPAGVQSHYRCASSCALLHPIHLERLANCTRKFLTSTQTGQAVSFIFETLQALWNQISATTDTESSDRLAATFCFSARLASIVLTSLPLQALPDTTLQEVNNSINEIRSAFLPRALSKALKIIRKNVSNSWASQVVAAAILRLQYALDTPHTEKLWAKLGSESEDEQILPELSLEIFRMLLKWSSVDEPVRTQDVMDRVLSYLESAWSSSETSWSGASSSLTFGQQGKEESMLAILYTLVDRWLPMVDAVASPAQLQRLVKILFTPGVGTYVYAEERVNATSLLVTALSSAQFWELPNLRTAILTYADEATSILADPHMVPTADNRASVLSTYQLLLTFPIEFMSRTIRTELVRRAVHADIVYSAVAGAEGLLSAVTVVRVFIHDVFLYLGSVDQPISNLARYLSHLIHHNSSSQLSQNYAAVTLSLVGLHFAALLKSSEEGSIEATVDVLRSCLPSDILNSVNASRVLVRLVDTLTKGFSPDNFSKEVRDEINDLQGRLSVALASHSEDMGSLFASEEFMNLWVHALLLRRWIKVDGVELPFVGRKLCSRVRNVSGHSIDELDGNRAAAFAILTEELHSTPERDRLAQLGLILATYVSFVEISGKSQTVLDQLFSQTCNTLSSAEFGHVLGLTRECLSDTAHASHHMPQLVHSAALLLLEHPTGTLKHTQNFLTGCLNLFTGHPEFTNGPLPLRLEVLRLLRQQCSDSPAVLRTQDIGCVWSLLSKFLTRSKLHDEKTSNTVFHGITVIVGALIRLRRDLVSLTLPNVAMVLQQLVATIRRPRPQLGAKQTALVTDTLPRWINAAFPVGPEEGKALARLLETLTTKTTVRSHSSSTDAQRAESLARPFSKHAAYIIQAYIDAMNDPLCILPAELRKELRPGLFALCNMLNDHNRDAMMVSALDAGGKAIMKNLWTEYEKQKYIGKG